MDAKEGAALIDRGEGRPTDDGGKRRSCRITEPARTVRQLGWTTTKRTYARCSAKVMRYCGSSPAGHDRGGTCDLTRIDDLPGGSLGRMAISLQRHGIRVVDAEDQPLPPDMGGNVEAVFIGY